MCSSGSGDCLTEMQTLEDRMDKACSDLGGNADDTMPTECSHRCAVVASPFLTQCGSVLQQMMRSSNDPNAAATADGLSAMQDLCDAALHGDADSVASGH